MHTGTAHLIFDSGEVYQESWDFDVATPAEALKNLRLVVNARLALFTTRARFVRLQVKGAPLAKVDLRGKAAGWAWPREALNLRDGGRATKKVLRGVPSDICESGGLTTAGTVAFRSLNQVLGQCRCFVADKDRRPELAPSPFNPQSLRKPQRVTKTRIVGVLGVEEGQRFWDVLKGREPAAAAT